jgi:hypothetical protein
LDYTIEKFPMNQTCIDALLELDKLAPKAELAIQIEPAPGI